MSALLTVGVTGNVPASALFASNARYKRESYRGSEFAPRVLAENGLPVVMKVCLLIGSRISDAELVASTE